MSSNPKPDSGSGNLGYLPMLTRWITWFTWIMLFLGLFFLVLYLIFRSPASLLISALMTVVLFPVCLYAVRAARHGRPTPALVTITFCCWALGLLVAARGHTSLPASLPLVLMPVIFALPYVTQKTLLKIGVGALLVCLIASGMTVGPPLLASRIDEHTLGIIMIPIIAISAGLALFALWYVGSALRSSLRETELTNERLADSERVLEQRIQARTVELRQAVSELSDIEEIARAVNVTLDLDAVIDSMRSALQRVVSFDYLSVLLLSEDRTRLMVDHVAGIDYHAEEYRRILKEGVPVTDESSVFTAALQRKTPLLVPEIGADQLSAMADADRAVYNVNPVRSMLACPLEFAGKSIGVLTLARKNEPMPLIAEEVNRIERYITPLAIVIRNARLLEEAEAAKADAIESSNAKSQFLANMSHELRTPLNAILGYSEMLAEDAKDSGHSQYLPDLRRIRSSGHALLQLIKAVLDLTRIEAGNLEVQPSEFDVADLLEGVLTETRSWVEKQDDELTYSADSDLGLMLSDRKMLHQILVSLLDNACKFTHEGTVRLEVTRNEKNGSSWLQFKVIDTGIGISPEQLARIFEPFTQADESASRRYTGAGLGLTITREYCELLGGTIEVASEVGKGSTFTVSLPAQVGHQDQPK